MLRYRPGCQQLKKIRSGQSEKKIRQKTNRWKAGSEDCWGQKQQDLMENQSVIGCTETAFALRLVCNALDEKSVSVLSVQIFPRPRHLGECTCHRCKYKECRGCECREDEHLQSLWCRADGGKHKAWAHKTTGSIYEHKGRFRSDFFKILPRA
jgi:hypothetical protein